MSDWWFLIREKAEQKEAPQYKALYLWLTPEGEDIPLNAKGFPVGVPLRAVARKLAELGVTNGKGGDFHPWHLQQLVIYKALADVAAEVLGHEEADAREALLGAILDACRHKRPYKRKKREL